MDERRHLIIVTKNFPFAHGEHLLKYELEYMKRQFDKVTIVCQSDLSLKKLYDTRDIDVERSSFRLTWYEKILSLKYFSHVLFWKEIYTILFVYKKYPSIRIINVILQSILIGKRSQGYFEGIIKKNPSFEQTVLYSWWTDTVNLGFIALSRRRGDVVTITRARAVDLYFERKKTSYLPFRNLIYSSLDKTYCISVDGINYIRDKIGVSSNSRISLLRIGSINRQSITPTVLDNPVFTLVSCSNVIRLKRIEMIISALSLIESVKIHWIHFGDGPLYSDIERNACNTLGGKSNITYSFKGFIENEKLLDFYRDNYVDLFINVSKYEGVPVSIMEAMSFAIPVIATNVGGVSEIVNENNGFLLSSDLSEVTLSQTMQEYANLSRESQFIYRTNARLTWEKEWNADTNFKLLSESIGKY